MVTTAVRTAEISPEIQEVIDRVEKLLRLAAKNQNEAEAAVATSKAQALLVAYNLDMASIEHSSGKGAKRVDEQITGGFYKYQRRLWYAIAELNFCLYWNMNVWKKDLYTVSVDRYDGSRYKSKGAYRQEHRIVGRQVNVISSQNMARYLEQTIDRILKERLGDGWHSQWMSKWACSYREGMADRIIEKIQDRRRELISQETAERERKEREARAAGAEGISLSTALTIGSVAQRERDANYDAVFGEGWSAQQAAQRAQQAEASRQAREAYTQWAEANPEEARKEAEAERKRNKVRAYRPRAEARDNRDQSAYYHGYEDGKKVSIDRQVDKPKETRSITA